MWHLWTMSKISYVVHSTQYIHARARNVGMCSIIIESLDNKEILELLSAPIKEQ